jgi:hypothetical protein
MVGAEVDTGDTTYVVLFSSDPGGAAPKPSIIYDVGANSNGRHFLFNLAPLVGYNVELVRRDGGATVVVTRGSGYTSSEQGTLIFDVPVSDPEPKLRFAEK